MPINSLLSFPINSYLIVRLDYIIICQNDELEAKVLRLIERFMDDERQSRYRAYLNDSKNEITPDTIVEITKDVWVPISHRLFMNELYGLVKSENTLKKAIKSLIDKKFIRMQLGTAKYEAPHYQIDVDVVQTELDKLKQLGKAGYQKLIPSKIDTIKKRYHQKLIPSKIDPLRVSKIDTNSKDITVKREESVCNDPLSLDETPSPDTHTPENENHSHIPQGGCSDGPLPSLAVPPPRRLAVVVPTAPRAPHTVPGTGTNARPAQSPSPSPGRPTHPPAWVALLDRWDEAYGPSPRPKWVIEEAQQIISRMKGDFDDIVWIYNKIEREGLNKGKPITFEMVYNHWHFLKAKRANPSSPPSEPKLNGKVNWSKKFALEDQLRQAANAAGRKA